MQGQLAQEVAQAAIAGGTTGSGRGGARRQRRSTATGGRGGGDGRDGGWSGRRARRAAQPPPMPPTRRAAAGRSADPSSAGAPGAWPRCRRRCHSSGVPYVFGGESPGSASTARAWSSGHGRRPACPYPGRPRRSGRHCTHVSLDALQPGDLLFYYNLDGDNQVDHVVMYTGSGPYGTNTVIQAPFTGSTVSYSPIFTDGLIGAARP